MRSEMYTATQGLIARQLQLDSISNNIANIATTGFRETSPFFRSFNRALNEGPLNPMNSAANNQPVAAGVYMHDRQGALKETDNPLDLAIDGDGFFKVQTPFGDRYTRNGHFTLQKLPNSNTTAEIVTANGYKVLDTNGRPIQLDLQIKNTYINRDGVVIQDGNNLGQIALVDFADRTQLTAEEDTLLTNQDPLAQEIQGQGDIRGGYLETSNVNVAQEMIQMIEAQRAFELNTRAIRTIDTGMNQTVIQAYAAR